MIFYTDGSTAPTNPGPGGYAVIHAIRSAQIGPGPAGGGTHYHPVALGSEPGMTTNIRMEGMAIIEALKLSEGKPCEIRTDSLFWINVMTKWIAGWEKKKFQNVKNLDLVTEMDYWYKKSDATLVHVRGHKGEPGNEMADEYANKARMGTRL